MVMLFSNKQYSREFVPSVFGKTYTDPSFFGPHICDGHRPLYNRVQQQRRHYGCV
jgi:hypothetical protein